MRRGIKQAGDRGGGRRVGLPVLTKHTGPKASVWFNDEPESPTDTWGGVPGKGTQEKVGAIPSINLESAKKSPMCYYRLSLC